jgi:3-methyladenine DNA glycosylase AlkD
MSKIPRQSFVQALDSGLRELSNPAKVPQMEAYMKNLFPYVGVMTTERRLLFKALAESFQLKKAPLDADLVLTLWERKEREFAYVAMDYIALFEKKLNASHLNLIQQLIITKSWWDTVDYLASHALGNIFKNNPELIPSSITSWVNSDNIWLNRSAILFQLNYKKNTDEELLYYCIKQLKDKKEFFIQKAIGWALRNYSRTNADWVRQTTEELRLSGLARREALRLM